MKKNSTRLQVVMTLQVLANIFINLTHLEIHPMNCRHPLFGYKSTTVNSGIKYVEQGWDRTNSSCKCNVADGYFILFTSVNLIRIVNGLSLHGLVWATVTNEVFKVHDQKSGFKGFHKKRRNSVILKVVNIIWLGNSLQNKALLTLTVNINVNVKVYHWANGMRYNHCMKVNVNVDKMLISL